jgi:carbamoyl-phosphate synthase small subunit
MNDTQERPGYLLLEDGRQFEGRYLGPATGAPGEAVFTTVMTGYQETLTDPSFAGQIVVMTAPMMGVYGVRPADDQSRRPWVAGFVVRHLSRVVGDGPAAGTLPSYLHEHGIPTLVGADTRAITRHIRAAGAMRAILAPADIPLDEARDRLAAEPEMLGRDLASTVSTPEPYELPAPDGDLGLVLCLDYGVKTRSLELLRSRGYRVRVTPASTTPDELLSQGAKGLFVSNGPGDPEAVPGAAERIRAVSDAGLPVFGICLGHQLIARAFGGRNYKLPYGHRGGNHPVQNLETGAVEITSQNHGFAVLEEAGEVVGAPALEITHRNLNDGTVEGVLHRERPVSAVQFHPESAPGPHDSRYLFDRFVSAIAELS